MAIVMQTSRCKAPVSEGDALSHAGFIVRLNARVTVDEEMVTAASDTTGPRLQLPA